ncbi:hypothetical protein DFQ14_102248 [Halopolyspora algeriensis]|uniref:Uncharacterized protein n=1 Tax=Halopolyspora algeriensis TaxID=1500506 RepID=A0A368VV26_9ACTN|nr:hypothetical protein [Halopolyspora algeriensis]RCW45946.1 hypothetical protein DFQ14_102248 [Halopolyspora algeriensis]TQM55359.1 hypothetical protein FHU43_0122 [Halopolyspora algeriensis]
MEQDPNRPLRDEDMETVGAGGIAARTKDADTQDADQSDDADTQDADGTDQSDDADTQDSDSDSRDS